MQKFLIVIALSFLCTEATAVEFHSAASASTVIELYTSEGCSSCPPADKWLSQFRHHPELFTRIVPMAFHVDYWDYIGWQDPFAQQGFSQRQRKLSEQGILYSVYTPAFVVNSKEWRRWFKNRSSKPLFSTDTPGILSGSVRYSQKKRILNVSFPSARKMDLHIAYLGMGLQSHVTAGENKRKELHHDFVVLKHWKNSRGKLQDRTVTWTATLIPEPKLGQQQTALVVWVTERNDPHIIQATGTFLNTPNTFN